METMRKLSIFYALFCLLLLSSCDNHPFAPLANDMADKWDEIWSLAQEYEDVNYTALMKEKMDIANNDKEKAVQLGRELDNIVKKGSELMKGKEVNVELPKGYKGYRIPDPWTIDKVSMYIPTRITIKGSMEFTEEAGENDEDSKKTLWLVAFAGNEPVCLFKTVDRYFEKLSDDNRVIVGTRIVLIEQSPDIYAYQWERVASITRLAWVFEDSEEFQKAQEGLARDFEFEKRFHKIKID